MFWKHLVKAFKCFADIVLSIFAIVLCLVLSAVGLAISMLPILIPCGTVAFVAIKLLG